MRSKRDVALEIAAWHLGPDGAKAVYLCASQDGEKDEDPIKLLEISDNTIQVGVIPVHFGVSKSLPYPVVVIELTDQESNLELPRGWERWEFIGGTHET